MTDAQWLLSEFLDLSHATQHEYAVGDQADQYEANRKRAEAIIARLAAAEAERDAAVKKHDDLVNYLQRDKSVIIIDALKEGERRATAAIVDWLRSRGDCWTTDNEVADIFERGDHLKAPK